jgi:hypothetical protein
MVPEVCECWHTRWKGMVIYEKRIQNGEGCMVKYESNMR